MPLQLTLPPALEDRLRGEAQRQGQAPDILALELLEKHLPPADPAAGLRELFAQWQAEDEIPVASWGGVLKFTVVSGEGFDPDWLRAEPLEVRPRGGGERFKPHPTRPSKTLKRLFQDAGIAEFERGRLPLLWRDGELIYVAGLGADVRFTDRNGERIVIEWEPDASLLERDS